MALGPRAPDPLARATFPKPTSRHRRGESYGMHAKPILADHTTSIRFPLLLRDGATNNANQHMRPKSTSLH